MSVEAVLSVGTDRGGRDDPTTPGPLHAYVHVGGPLHQSVYLRWGGGAGDTDGP